MITVSHPWHGLSFGQAAPRIVNAIIEIPQGSRAKYEIDKETGLLKLDRVIYSSFYYPCNYGFIPQTYGDDKDPLDILVITTLPVQALCLMEAKVIGVMQGPQLVVGGPMIIEVPIELRRVEAQGPACDLRMTLQTFVAAGIVPNLRVSFALVLNVNVFIQAFFGYEGGVGL